MSTSYVFTEVPVLDDLRLYIDGNSKVTVGNGTYDAPVPNALSLPHISTCPGSTEDCRQSCYVFGLQKNAPEVYAKYAQNERVLHRLLMSVISLGKSAKGLAAWITSNCPDGFRWHISGDIISNRHAEWITVVALNSPSVRHWIYTRTFEVVARLGAASNLVVNLSADSENYAKALSTARTHLNTRVCYLTRDGSLPAGLPEDSVIFPDYALRGRDLDKPTEHTWWQGLSQDYRRMVCPADFFGQSEQHRCGPCKKCLVHRSR